MKYQLTLSLQIQSIAQVKFLDSGDTENVNVSILIKYLPKAWEQGTR